MRIILIAFYLLPLSIIAQTLPEFGVYCANNSSDDCVLIDEDPKSKADAPSVYLTFPDAEARAFYSRKKKYYEAFIKGKLAYTFIYIDGDLPEILVNKADQEEIKRYTLFPVNDEVYIADHSEVETDEEEDLERSGNLHHIANLNFFNLEGVKGFPFEMNFFDVPSPELISKTFDHPENIPEATKSQIVGLLEVLDTNYAYIPLYAIYNDTDQAYWIYNDANELRYGVKISENQGTLELIDPKSKQSLGKMHNISSTSELLLTGKYTTEDRLSLVIELTEESSIIDNIELQLVFSSSPYGKRFLMRRGENGTYLCALPTDPEKVYYELVYDDEGVGAIQLTDLKTKKRITADYSY